MVLARKTTAAACALAVAAGGVAACGGHEEEGRQEEPSREGLALPLGDVTYNVFITRQLNPNIPPDDAYYQGPPAPEGETFYGVFVQVCNNGKRPSRTASEFEVVDNQGNRFEPRELPRSNPFAYQPQVLEGEECVPRKGSVAQLGPTSAAMLLFQLPLDVTENRPLELEIGGPRGEDPLRIELDL